MPATSLIRRGERSRSWSRTPSELSAETTALTRAVQNPENLCQVRVSDAYAMCGAGLRSWLKELRERRKAC